MLQRNAKPYDLIAVNLRIAWSDVVTEPLSDRIRRLLEQLADRETERERERDDGGTESDAGKHRHH